MIPFYFGAPPKRLYGCHHLPQVSCGMTLAVVLCYPIGQEYIQTHRVIYQLGVLLSRVGFHVLRFDYFGCGDSEGHFEQGSLAQWTDDLHRAVEEIQNRSGLTKVCLIGLRVGANLALQLGADCPDLHSAVLWEPIFDGKLYLKEMAHDEAQYLNRTLYQQRASLKRLRAQMQDELFGFPMTSDLRKDLEMINLRHVRVRPNVRVLVLCNREESDRSSDLRHLIQSNPHADFRVIPEQTEVWKVHRRLTPSSSLQYIVEWLDRVRT